MPALPLPVLEGIAHLQPWISWTARSWELDSSLPSFLLLRRILPPIPSTLPWQLQVSPTSLCRGLSHLAPQLGPAVSPQQGQGHVGPTGGTCFVLCPWEAQGPLQHGNLTQTHGREMEFPPQNTGESQKGSTPRASHTINTPHTQEPGAIFACRKLG